MKKWFLLACCVFLMACTDNKTSQNSPETALNQIASEEGYAKVKKTLATIEISENQVFYIFEGELNNNTEWYVASIKKDEDADWFVEDAINIEKPNNTSPKTSFGTNTFKTGIIFNKLKAEDDWKIVEIPEENCFVWIKLLES